MLISLWTTDFCNMKCPYCYTSKSRDLPQQMTEDMEEKIIDFIEYEMKKNPSETLGINFFGGEPLLNFDFIKTFTNKLEKLKDKWINNPLGLLITTNGTLLDKNIVDFLHDHNFGISISLDGIPKIHNRTRILKNNEPSWNIIEKNLKYALEKIPDIYARMTYTSDTVKYLHEGIDFMAKIGFKNIKPVPDFFDSNWNKESFDILKTQIRKILKDYENNYSQNNIEVMFLKEKLVKKKYLGCGGGTSSFSIASNGDIYPCTYVVKEPKFCLGNINNLNSIIAPDYTQYKNQRLSCEKCKYYECCESSRCVYVNYKMTGTMTRPNGFYCNYEKLLFKIGDILNNNLELKNV